MTDAQFLTLVGTIYIAPHINNWVAQALGLMFIIFAAFGGLTK